MFKLKRLDSRGVAHHLVLVLVVLGVATGGTYYLVKSHADPVTVPSQAQLLTTYDTCRLQAIHVPNYYQRDAAEAACTTAYQNGLAQLRPGSRITTVGNNSVNTSTSSTVASPGPSMSGNTSSSSPATSNTSSSTAANHSSTSGTSSSTDASSNVATNHAVSSASSASSSAAANASGIYSCGLPCKTKPAPTSTPQPAQNALMNGTEASAPACDNVYGLGAYLTGQVDSHGNAVVIHCSEPRGNDPCGYTGSTPVPCTPARTTAAGNTCNYGGTYPDCIRVLGGARYSCPANDNGSTICDLSTSKPVSANTPVPNGCYSTLDGGQKYVYCSDGTTVKSTSPTDYDATQQFNKCVTAAGGVYGTTKYGTALNACQTTYDTALNGGATATTTTSTTQKAPTTPSKASSGNGFVCVISFRLLPGCHPPTTSSTDTSDKSSKTNQSSSGNGFVCVISFRLLPGCHPPTTSSTDTSDKSSKAATSDDKSSSKSASNKQNDSSSDTKKQSDSGSGLGCTSWVSVTLPWCGSSDSKSDKSSKDDSKNSSKSDSKNDGKKSGNDNQKDSSSSSKSSNSDQKDSSSSSKSNDNKKSNSDDKKNDNSGKKAQQKSSEQAAQQKIDNQKNVSDVCQQATGSPCKSGPKGLGGAITGTAKAAANGITSGVKKVLSIF